MADQKPLPGDKALVASWTASVQHWGDESGDFALPIPLEIQQALGLNDGSIVNAEIVEGRFVIVPIHPKNAINDNDA